MASELCEAEGIAVQSVRVRDDVVSAPKASAETRRAVAGLFFAYKISGTKAETGAQLAAVAGIVQRVLAEAGAMVSLASTTSRSSSGK